MYGQCTRYLSVSKYAIRADKLHFVPLWRKLRELRDRSRERRET